VSYIIQKSNLEWRWHSYWLFWNQRRGTHNEL